MLALTLSVRKLLASMRETARPGTQLDGTSCYRCCSVLRVAAVAADATVADVVVLVVTAHLWSVVDGCCCGGVSGCCCGCFWLLVVLMC